MPTFYPFHSFNSNVHVIELNKKNTLCGMRPPPYWQMEFEGDPFPEIGDFITNHPHTLGEGFNIGRSFAGQNHFCPKCYQKLKKLKNV